MIRANDDAIEFDDSVNDIENFRHQTSLVLLPLLGPAQLQEGAAGDHSCINDLIIGQVGPMLPQQGCQLHQTSRVATSPQE